MAGTNSLCPRLVNSTSRGGFHSGGPWGGLKFQVNDCPKCLSLQQWQILLTDWSTVILVCVILLQIGHFGAFFILAMVHRNSPTVEIKWGQIGWKTWGGPIRNHPYTLGRQIQIRPCILGRPILIRQCILGMPIQNFCSQFYPQLYSQFHFQVFSRFNSHFLSQHNSKVACLQFPTNETCRKRRTL